MRWIPASILLASLAIATVPYTFPTGVPAKASQVNRNFEALDSLLSEQIDQVVELRQSLVAQTDSLRKDLAALRRKAVTDSIAIRSEMAADTGWRILNLPKGSVLGMVALPGPDGFLPGSDKIWQVVDSFGIVEGMPAVVPAPSVAAPPVVEAPVAVKTDSVQVATLSADTARPATVAVPAPAPSKSVFHWFVKVK